MLRMTYYTSGGSAAFRLGTWEALILADEAGSTPVDFIAGDSGKQSAIAIELWGKVRPQLEKALGHYDKLDAASLLDTAVISTTKRRATKLSRKRLSGHSIGQAIWLMKMA
jgi:hypothetical protein